MSAINTWLHHGFTLIELLITTVIVGILLASAYPSYTQYVIQSHRIDALNSLLRDQLILERCYSANFSYTAACDTLPTFPQRSEQGYYQIAISNLGSSTYTLTATPVGSQTQDTRCAVMIINQANVRTSSTSSGIFQPGCWNSSNS